MKIKHVPIFSLAVFEAIRETIGKLPPESGGMLCGNPKNDSITYFYFDRKAECSSAGYSPDTTTLNNLLKKLNDEGLRLKGFVHSHPIGFDSPSGGDLFYADKFFAAIPDLSRLVIPIVDSIATDRPFQMRVFVATRKGDNIKVNRVPLHVVEMETGIPEIAPPAAVFTASADAASTATTTTTETPKSHSMKNMNTESITTSSQIDTELFNRVATAYTLKLLAESRQVRIGVGSSNRSLEDAARAGCGQFVLIDNGRVEHCNLATQSYFLEDIGKPKVEVMADRLRAINPTVAVKTVFGSFHDISDAEFKRFAFESFVDATTSVKAGSPKQTVIVGATDDFFCQCRVNALALNFGLPSLCCQHYLNGLASEITFTHPQTVRACHRCILSGRYQAYLKDGYQNAVGSAGSPISSVAMLNAITVSLMLAMLHHGTVQPRWGHLLARIGDRNLVQIRNHPDVEELLGLKNFSQAFAGAHADQIFFGECIWRRQQPEHPTTGYSRPCPDCGGTGDLTRRIGAFADTRIINP